VGRKKGGTPLCQEEVKEKGLTAGSKGEKKEKEGENANLSFSLRKGKKKASFAD